jgi:uncharacterized protein
MNTAQSENELPQITSLPKVQRRVLGVLVEKGITVPESYPLSLNALVSGCNQKSNRHPMTNYDEGDVLEAIEALGKQSLVAVVHTETGRTERYRHYLRRRFSTLSEPQVAILTELLLRGRQALGELRARASRMAPAGTLDSLDQLRSELAGLMAAKIVRSDAPLERRGVEIDHNLYEPGESLPMTPRAAEEEPSGEISQAAAPRQPAAPSLPAGDLARQVESLRATTILLANEIQKLRDDVEALRSDLGRASEEIRELRRALGG